MKNLGQGIWTATHFSHKFSDHYWLLWVEFQTPNHTAVSFHIQILPWLLYDECSHELKISMPIWTVVHTVSFLMLINNLGQMVQTQPVELLHYTTWLRVKCCTPGHGSSTICTSLRTGSIWSFCPGLFYIPKGCHCLKSSFLWKLAISGVFNDWHRISFTPFAEVISHHKNMLVTTLRPCTVTLSPVSPCSYNVSLVRTSNGNTCRIKICGVSC